MALRDGLQATSKGARVSVEPDGRRTVVDGPFTKSKELIAGYWIWDVRSKEEAMEWAKRVPFPSGTTLEMRQVFESDDCECGTTDEFGAVVRSYRTTTKPRRRELRP